MISFSVIMPTYNQKGFIRNAIRSLFAQTYTQWELIIVDDGCTDGTKEFISDYLSDSRVTYLQNEKNEGIGYAINRALDVARYDYIAYLPSDDFYFSNHLEVMKDMFKKDSTCVLVYTQMKSELQDSLLDKSNEAVNGLVLFQSLQMVQTAHKKTLDRWVEREEYESEDLYNRVEELYEACGNTFVSEEEAEESMKNARLAEGLTDEIYEAEVGYYE